MRLALILWATLAFAQQPRYTNLDLWQLQIDSAMQRHVREQIEQRRLQLIREQELDAALVQTDRAIHALWERRRKDPGGLHVAETKGMRDAIKRLRKCEGMK